MNETVTLYTPEGEALAAEGFAARPWNEYPRPQLRRDSFLNLNGAWEFRVGGGEAEQILVPFPPESALSRIGRAMPRGETMHYRRRFSLPDGFAQTDKRVILHFGAVDQHAEVSLNSLSVGRHSGGYDAFSFDITEYLTPGENTLDVLVRDDLDCTLPYGKQSSKRGGMWYTPISGIWQTVWLEAVPAVHVKGLRITPATDTVVIAAEGIRKGTIAVETPEGKIFADMAEEIAEIRIPSPRRWSPEDPYLYRFTLQAGEDLVESYFALRTLEIRTVDGHPRLCLNGKPYFFNGLLDQGYFSDGIYTPASPICYEEDILAMKALGFNTLRKHIKIEPDAFYYACDRLGMIVFQDMVNNGNYSFLRDTALPTIGMKRFPDRLLHPRRAERQAFFAGMDAAVRQLYNFPCICCWTIFNEGWGQFDSQSAYVRMKQLDATRFVDTVSGWFKPLFRDAQSDVESLHVYFKPYRHKPARRPVVLSEFGGYALAMEGHRFNPQKVYGYRLYDTPEALAEALERLYTDEIAPAIPCGLCAAIYTQVSDVEDETNGLLTYDRRVNKLSGLWTCRL